MHHEGKLSTADRAILLLLPEKNRESGFVAVI